MSYSESNITAKVIMTKYESLHHVTLVAPPQSGKTSIYLTLAKMGMGTKWDKIILLCNMSDNALKYQTMRRFSDAGIDADILFGGELTGIKKMSPMSFLQRYAGRVLVIVDESHMGASIGQGISNFFSLLGVSANGEYDEDLYVEGREKLHRPYILTVSATPYAEASIMTDKKDIVLHIPGPKYIGIQYLGQKNVLKKIPDNWTLAMREALVRQKQKVPRSYAIVRWGAVTSGYHDAIGAIVESLGYPTIMYDQSYTKNGNALLDGIVSEKPSEFTVILIKNHCSAGQTFTKKNISLVWENRDDTDSQVQGLPGRCCGYYDRDERKMLPNMEIWCDRDAMIQHSRFFSSIYKGEGETPLIPRSGTNIKLVEGGTRKYIHDPQYMTFREYDSIDAVNEDIPKMRDYFHDNPIFCQQPGWYQSCPRFGLRKGRRELSMEGATDEDGFVHQYLQVKRTDNDANMKPWSVEEVRRYLNKRPSLNAKTITLESDGQRWRNAKVAMVAYRDLNDPTSRVYLVYSYNGPVKEVTDKNEVCGTATDNSIYVHGIGPSRHHTTAKFIAIPDNHDRETIIRDYGPRIMTMDDPTVFILESERNDIRTLAMLNQCADEAFDRLEWAGKCSPSLSFLQPIIDRRMRSIAIRSFVTQPDAIRYLLRSMGATSAQTGVKPREVRDSIHAQSVQWRWKTSINGAVGSVFRQGVISRTNDLYHL